MTLRLVGLMSLVLLLSLAAFGLLMSLHQDQLMQEVTRTISDVGRATLLEMERHQWSAMLPGPGFDVAADLSGTGSPGTASRTVMIAIEAGGIGEVEYRLSERPAIGGVRLRDDASSWSFGECVEPPGGGSGFAMFQVNVEAVRAENDPGEGLVLTIPRLMSEPAEGPGDGGLFPGDFELVAGAAAGIGTDEIRLPIPQAGYEDLFHRLRRRSMWVFLGVFVVGMAATAGAATRFTRPVRRLDRAIRRLSAGDLDVSVRAESQDEIGRLSRAFNEMAGRLRTNRDRAREMARREKLSALGRLAAGVAHDVRNPLHSIGLTLQHLDEAARPEAPASREEFDRSVAIIRGEIRRLDRLVGNFLSFARSERRPRVLVDLGGLFGEIARLVQKEAERRGVELDLQIDTEVPPIRADGEALRSSILNLVLNSFEAMPGGGKLTLGLGAADGHATIEVRDDGEGIPVDEQEHVFDFDFTTRDEGHGLGLAMVHHVAVEEHGGQVCLESRPGEGTSVRLVLPITGPDADVPS